MTYRRNWIQRFGTSRRHQLRLWRNLRPPSTLEVIWCEMWIRTHRVLLHKTLRPHHLKNLELFQQEQQELRDLEQEFMLMDVAEERRSF